jgi:hypothetical protein
MSYQQQPGGWQDPAWSAPNQPPSAPGHQGHPGNPGSASPAPAASTPGDASYPHANTLAVASLAVSLGGLLVCGFPALIGAIIGHIARKQIRQRVAYVRRFLEVQRPADVTPQQHESLERTLVRLCERRNGVALAGIIIGWIGFVLWLGFWVPFAWGFFGAATGSTS